MATGTVHGKGSFKNMQNGAVFARPNLFEVHIEPKNNINSHLLRRLNINCFSATIPDVSFATYDRDADDTAIAYTRLFGDFTLGFYCHQDMKEYKIMQDWTKLIVNPKKRCWVGFYDDYVADIIVYTLDRQQKKSMTTTIWEAYPKSISAISLAYDASDIIKINVTFMYAGYSQTYQPGQVQDINGTYYENNQEEVDVDNVVANDPSAILHKTKTLKVGQGIRSGGDSLLDFRGAQ